MQDVVPCSGRRVKTPLRKYYPGELSPVQKVGPWRPETAAVLVLLSLLSFRELIIHHSASIAIPLICASAWTPPLLVPDRWHAEEALCCLSICRWLQGCHSGWAYSWGGSLFSQRNMGAASEVSARYVVFFSTLNKCIVEGKRKSIWFMTVLKIATCLCKSIVACTKEWTETMQDKDAQISHLYSSLLLFMSQFMNKFLLGYEGGQVKSENNPWCSAVSCLASNQPCRYEIINLPLLSTTRTSRQWGKLTHDRGCESSPYS